MTIPIKLQPIYYKCISKYQKLAIEIQMHSYMYLPQLLAEIVNTEKLLICHKIKIMENYCTRWKDRKPKFQLTATQKLLKHFRTNFNGNIFPQYAQQRNFRMFPKIIFKRHARDKSNSSDFRKALYAYFAN